MPEVVKHLVSRISHYKQQQRISRGEITPEWIPHCGAKYEPYVTGNLYWNDDFRRDNGESLCPCCENIAKGTT